MALITVSSETIAEEIRAKFSGQTIDDGELFDSLFRSHHWQIKGSSSIRSVPR